MAANLATVDHNVPIENQSAGVSAIEDPTSRLQVQTLDENCDAFNVTQFKMGDPRAGIVHVIGPEQGATLPGMTVVCGDSHTATHGAFAALAHGIGTSEVEHVLTTQCLVAKKMKNMRVTVTGPLGLGDCEGRHSCDYRASGTAGGTGWRSNSLVGDSVTFNGRSDDGMQYGNRSWCARWIGCC